MANLTGVGAVPLQFDKTIDKMVLKSYVEYTPEYTSFAKVVNGVKGRVYTEAQIAGLGYVQEKADGSGVELDVIKDGHKHSIYFKEYGLGFAVTRNTLEDELHGLIKKAAQNLGKQFAYRTDLDYWTHMAYGNDPAITTAWDGLAPFANNHTTLKSQQTINNVGAADLSETSLQAAFDYFYSGVYTAEGIPAFVNPDTLIVPSTNWEEARRLANQLTSVTQIVADMPTNNNINSVHATRGLLESPYSVFTSRILSQLLAIRGEVYEDAWFLVDKKELDIRLIWKRMFDRKQFTDPKTDNFEVKATSRYGIGWMDYIAAYGSFPSGGED